MSEIRTAPVLDRRLMTVTLAHRASRGPQPWWRSVVLYEYSLAACHDGDLAIDCIEDVVRLGADGVVVPSGEHPIDAAVADRVVAAHRAAGLRLVASLAPSRGHDALLRDAEVWLAAGADGIDLRSALAARQVRHTGPFHALVEAYRENGLLAGAMRERDDLTGHLAEDWLGHLRDDTLTDVPWRAEAIRAALTRTFTTRDAMGASPSWTTTYALYRTGPAGDSWQADRTPTERVRATALMVMALPGAVYLLQGEEVGMRDWSLKEEPKVRSRRVRAAQRAQAGDPTSMLEHYRRSLLLRAEHELGTGSVAWVDGEHRRTGSVELLNRLMLTVLNTGPDAVLLDAETKLEHASTDIRRTADGKLIVPADAAAMVLLPPFSA